MTGSLTRRDLVRTGIGGAAALAGAGALGRIGAVTAKRIDDNAIFRGNTIGSQFWGCSGYPECKGTRPLDGA